MILNLASGHENHNWCFLCVSCKLLHNETSHSEELRKLKCELGAEIPYRGHRTQRMLLKTVALILRAPLDCLGGKAETQASHWTTRASAGKADGAGDSPGTPLNRGNVQYQGRELPSLQSLQVTGRSQVEDRLPELSTSDRSNRFFNF